MIETVRAYLDCAAHALAGAMELIDEIELDVAMDIIEGVRAHLGTEEGME